MGGQFTFSMEWSTMKMNFGMCPQCGVEIENMVGMYNVNPYSSFIAPIYPWNGM